MMTAMRTQVRNLRLGFGLCLPLTCVLGFLAMGLMMAAPVFAQRPERPALNINGYAIDAELDPATHHLAARATVTFTAPETAAPETAESVSFGFHPALKVTKISDESGKVLTGERPADGAIRITPATPFVRGQAVRWTFEYEGTITGNESGRVEGLKLAAIQEPISYLLYPARWFPSTGYLTGRFTAEMHIRVPQGMRGFASGSQGAAQPAAREYDFFTGSFGAPETSHLNVVELPDDKLPAVWAPELAAIPGSLAGDKSGVRLLANTIARQWWGSEVSPRTLNDAWITNGMARYGELMYVEDESGKSALQAAIQDVSAGALAYDTIPLSSAGRLSPFSPEFQSMTLEKGAMIFHMLRWEVGDKAFLATLKGALSQYTGTGMRSSEFVKVAEAQSQQQLTAFFAQWVDGTGAPQFTDKYAVYRLGNNKGFRTIGEIG